MTDPSETASESRARRVVGSISTTATVLAVVVIVALIVVVGVVLTTTSSRHAVALFPRAASIYEGDAVRILGVNVGTVGKIEPQAQFVRVELSWDSEYEVPADVQAVVVSPTLVSTRFVQLTPVHSGGPTLEDGATIPLERTSTPMEFDDLKEQLNTLATSLGPKGANSNGSLSRFLDVTAANANGQGNRFKNTLDQLTRATDTLNRGSDDLFGTVRNLQIFTSALAANDEQIVEVNKRLGSVTGILADSRRDLDGALAEFDRLAPLVQQFFDENRDRIVETVDRTGKVTRNLAGVREDLALTLLVGGPAFQDFFNIYSPVGNAFTGGVAVPQVRNPAQLICGAIGATAPSAQAAEAACATALGPLLNAVTLPGLPVGVSPTGGTVGAATSGAARPGAAIPAVPGIPMTPAPSSLPELVPNLGGGNR